MFCIIQFGLLLLLLLFCSTTETDEEVLFVHIHTGMDGTMVQIISKEYRYDIKGQTISMNEISHTGTWYILYVYILYRDAREALTRVRIRSSVMTLCQEQERGEPKTSLQLNSYVPSGILYRYGMIVIYLYRSHPTASLP